MSLFTRARKIACAALVAVLAACAPDDPGPAQTEAAKPRAGGPPNIILILADDLGYGHVSAFGGRTPTPHIDALAKDGVLFTNAHTTGTNCAPSRAGMLTGRMQNEFGFEFNPGGQRGKQAGRGVPADVPMIQETLKAQGYTTGLVGKWHLGRAPHQRPNARGFDEFFGILDALSAYITAPKAGDVVAKGAYALRLFGQRLTAPVKRDGKTVRVKSYLTDAFTDEAVSFVERKADKPFFLYLAYTAPHTPLEATKKYLDRVTWTDDPREKTHDAMVLAVDDGVGAVVKQLKASGLYDNTIIVFLSDNGCPLRPGAKPYCSNAPFSGSKNTFWEGGQHTPLVIKGVGGAARGASTDMLVSAMDLAPTFAAAAGVKDAPKFTGADLSAHLRDPTLPSPHDWLAWRMGANAALISGQWKLYLAAKASDAETTVATPEDEGGAPNPFSAMRLMGDEAGKRERMPIYGTTAPDLGWHVMLYDLKSDIGEKSNRADAEPEQTARLKALLDAWAATLPKEPMWGPQSIRVYTTPDGARVRMPG